MYNFKTGPEIFWAGLTLITGVIATAVVTQGAVAPTDWRAFAIGIAAALARALPALIMSLTVGGDSATE